MQQATRKEIPPYEETVYIQKIHLHYPFHGPCRIPDLSLYQTPQGSRKRLLIIGHS